ncbi:MAG: hypothetical protein ABFR62_05470 [Bacteroidota bacterium]
MRTQSLYSLLFFFSLSLVSFISTSDNNVFKRYHIKSGKVVYKYEGKASGTKELYFDNWGMKEAQLDNMTIEVYGMTQKTNNLVILDNKEVSVINLNTKKAYKSDSNEILKLQKINPEEKDLAKLSEQMLKDAGGNKLPNENFLGKDCDVWDIHGVKQYSWKGIPLKIEITIMGMDIKMTATEISTDINIPSSKFEVPKGVVFEKESKVGFNF